MKSIHSCFLGVAAAEVSFKLDRTPVLWRPLGQLKQPPRLFFVAVALAKVA